MEKLALKNIVENASDPIWFKDPKILVRRDRVSEFFPNEEMTVIEKLNAIMRMTIYIGLLMAILCRNYLYLYIPVISGAITWTVFKVQNSSGIEAKEELYTTSSGQLRTKPTERECIEPTVDNPFMNYNQITSDRNRKPACISYDKPALKKKIESDFNVNLYRDVSDLYGRKNSQREFYTTPGSTFDGGVGDSVAFGKFCYQTGPNCKESGIQCTGNYSPQMYTATPLVNR